MANKRHKPRAKPARRPHQPQSRNTSENIGSRKSSASPRQQTYRTFWSFAWRFALWGSLGAAIGAVALIPFFVGTWLLGGFKSNGESYPALTTLIFVPIGALAFSAVGWVGAHFELRALLPLTGPIRFWRELGAVGSGLLGAYFCVSVSRNGGIKDLEPDRWIGAAVGLVGLGVTWLILRKQFDTANVWFGVSIGVLLLSKILNLVPGIGSGSQPFSFASTVIGAIGGAWAFWAMMQAAKNGTTFHGFWPQRAT